MGTEPKAGVSDQIGTVECHLDRELDPKIVELQTRKLTSGHCKWQERELEGFLGAAPVLPIVPESAGSLSPLPLPPNLLRNNISTK